MTRLSFIILSLISLAPSSLFATDCKTDTCRIFVISDLNGSYGSTHYAREVTKAVEYITAQKPDLVISTGDHVAGQKRGLNYQAMWDSFHRVVTNPLKNSSIPFLPTPGNHDASNGSSFQQERKTYRQNFSQPPSGIEFIDSSDFPIKYSYQFGGALFISLDATNVYLDQQQLSWLEKQLIEGQKYSSIILYGHVPLFPVAQNRERDYLRNNNLFDLIKKYNVTMWISGHHHAYYPGQKDGVKFYSLNCLGGGPRKLLAPHQTKRSAKGMIELHLKNGEISFIESYDVTQNFSIIDKATLPESVGIPSKKIFLDHQDHL